MTKRRNTTSATTQSKSGAEDFQKIQNNPLIDFDAKADATAQEHSISSTFADSVTDLYQPFQADEKTLAVYDSLIATSAKKDSAQNVFREFVKMSAYLNYGVYYAAFPSNAQSQMDTINAYYNEGSKERARFEKQIDLIGQVFQRDDSILVKPVSDGYEATFVNALPSAYAESWQALGLRAGSGYSVDYEESAKPVVQKLTDSLAKFFGVDMLKASTHAKLIQKQVPLDTDLSDILGFAIPNAPAICTEELPRSIVSKWKNLLAINVTLHPASSYTSSPNYTKLISADDGGYFVENYKERDLSLNQALGTFYLTVSPVLKLTKELAQYISQSDPC